MNDFVIKLGQAAAHSYLEKSAVSRKKLITAIRNAAPHSSISRLGKLSTKLRSSADKLDLENSLTHGGAFGFNKEKALVRYGGSEEAFRQMKNKVKLKLDVS